MYKLWSPKAWVQYLGFQDTDKKTLKRINSLIKSIERDGYSGIGRPEPLKYGRSGYWSLQIDKKNRLVFRIENDTLELDECGSHYGDK